MAAQGARKWIARNGAIVQIVTAIAAVLVAISAVVAVKFQIDAAAQVQREQSARDIYREYLNLSISRPELASPDYCAIRNGPQEIAYRNYVDYLLYTSEQMLAVSPDWEAALAEHMEPHAAFICGVTSWAKYPESVQAMVARARPRLCQPAPPPCP